MLLPTNKEQQPGRLSMKLMGVKALIKPSRKQIVKLKDWTNGKALFKNLLGSQPKIIEQPIKKIVQQIMETPWKTENVVSKREELKRDKWN